VKCKYTHFIQPLGASIKLLSDLSFTENVEVSCSSFDEDKGTLLIGSVDGNIRIIDLKNQEMKGPLAV
jgi:hypothetical protein